MNRKDFLLKGLLGTGVFVSATAMGKVIDNGIEELTPLDIIGFNHLPPTESNVMSKTILHKSETRGVADHGWLQSRHTFSFANYYNPERMHFGALRVLNDDIVAPGRGFGTHPHNNMEIISIPLEGDLEHKDSMGNVSVIRNGDIQVMSAGSGITHSEYNKNGDRQVKFLQIWLFPNQKDVTPRYDQLTLKATDRKNRFQQVLSPSANDEGVWIYQNAWFHLADFDSGIAQEYTFKKPGNGLYIFVLSGNLNVGDQSLSARDGLGVWDTQRIQISAEGRSEFLLMEVPMQL